MLDKKIRHAIQGATKESGQGRELAQKIGAWMEALVKGNESLEDKDSVHRRIELLYESTQLNEHEEDSHDDEV